MIPRFTWDQIIENSFYLWDSYINRPNFRAIQSFSTIWMLYYPIQWIGIFISYFLLVLSFYLLNSQLLRLLIPYLKKYYYSIAAFIGSIITFYFIVINEGYWYHSIVISIAFLALILYLSLRYLYIEKNNYYLYAILLLFCFNSMISFNYITLILILFFFIILRIKKILNGNTWGFYREDYIAASSIIGFLLYSIRVVIPTLSSSSFIEQEAEYELAQLSPSMSFIPIYRISYFFNLARFNEYLAENSDLIFFYLFPIIVILVAILLYKIIERKEIFIWLLFIFIFSIFSLQGSGFYEMSNWITNILQNEKLSDIITLPLRKPTKWALIIAFTYGSFVSIAVITFLKSRFVEIKFYKKYLKFVPGLLLITIIFVPFFISPVDQIQSGDLGGALNPIDIPLNYEQSKSYLTDFGTVRFPIQIERPALLLDERKITDEFFHYFYDRISYESGGFDSYPNNVKYIGMLYSGIVLDKIKNISQLMTPFGIENIVLDGSVSYDIPNTQWEPRLFTTEEFSNLERDLDTHELLNKTYDDQIISVYQNTDDISIISHSANPTVNFLDYQVMYMNESFLNNPLINLDGLSDISLFKQFIVPYHNTIIPFIILNNKENIITTSDVKFKGNWDSYQDGYIGIEPLSVLYKKYQHLGFPTYSHSAFATNDVKSSLSINTMVSKGNSYRIFLRIAGNSNISFNINKYQDEIDFNYPQFEYVDLGSHLIDSDELTIRLKNNQGNLIFDMIYIISNEEYLDIKEEISNQHNRFYIYPFEAENDLISRSSHLEQYEHSNGNYLRFVDTLWQDVDIINDANYSIGLKGSGNITIQIDDFYEKMILNKNLTFSSNIFINSGKQEIKISPEFQNNILHNPSFETPRYFQQVINPFKFENDSSLSTNWDYSEDQFTISLTNDAYEGKKALKVSTTNNNRTWSWIKSDPITVDAGSEYLVITHMQYKNVKASHIKLEYYDTESSKWVQLQPYIPYKKDGSNGWRTYSETIIIPEQTDQIRFVLNAGTVLDASKGKAITWFDEISLLKSIPNSSENSMNNIIIQDLPTNWIIDENSFSVTLSDSAYVGNNSLKVSTTNTNRTWSWIKSDPITVDAGSEYLVITHMQYKNVKASHIKLEYYDTESSKWVQLQPYIPYKKDGSNGWRTYSETIIIPEQTDQIRFVLNAGTVLDASKGKAITWFDEIFISKLNEVPTLDSLFLISSDNISSNVQEKPNSVITDLIKYNPTHYSMDIYIEEPTMISFAESFDPLWKGYILKDGKEIETIQSIQLYSTINGFYLTKNGNFTFDIKYEAQNMFIYGLIPSILIPITLIFADIYINKKHKKHWSFRFRKKKKNNTSNLKSYIITCNHCNLKINFEGIPGDTINLSCPQCGITGSSRLYLPIENLFTKQKIVKNFSKMTILFFFIYLIPIFISMNFPLNRILISISFLIFVPLFYFIRFNPRIPFFYSIITLFSTALTHTYFNETILADKFALITIWLLMVGLLCLIIEYLKK